ncbi:unnamed protein product [Mytilus coruscus]|uniref:Uncharacterized protein n=1 Tax=Mytilus coruscus TaxID=42192 RepID=A0A6J8C9S1_MYTCO|nr:unnamed protein product [Mytilus coruscus]
MSLLLKASNVSTPAKVIQLKGLRWKASPQLHLLLRKTREEFRIFGSILSDQKKVRGNSSWKPSCISVEGSVHRFLRTEAVFFCKYCEDFAVTKDNNYDADFLDLCNCTHELISNIYALDKSQFQPVTALGVENAISSLNTGKACDEFGISAEHSKASGYILIPYLTTLFNEILTTRQVPDILKGGLLFPV